MTKRAGPSNYYAYMLRCWHEGGRIAADSPGWRFSLEDPHTGTRHGFGSFDALTAFLREQLSGSLWDGDGAQADAGTGS